MSWPQPAPNNLYLRDHVRLLTQSYQRLMGQPLITRQNSSGDDAAALWDAPYVVASHGTEKDPLFNYANRAALSLWDMTWDEFTALPSRLSAEPVERQQREALLHAVTTHGYIKHYSGIRISKTKKRFLITNATVWNIYDEHGIYSGQAVYFSEWKFLNNINEG